MTVAMPVRNARWPLTPRENALLARHIMAHDELYPDTQGALVALVTEAAVAYLKTRRDPAAVRPFMRRFVHLLDCVLHDAHDSAQGVVESIQSDPAPLRFRQRGDLARARRVCTAMRKAVRCAPPNVAP